MKDLQKITIRPAQPTDAEDLARLIDIAGEGIPTWLWTQSAAAGQSPLEVGVSRAQRETGGFSYRNALVAGKTGAVLGMALSFPIDTAPDPVAPDLPAPIVPFIELEAQSVGTWYINALAVRAGSRGAGIGSQLMAKVERCARDAGYGTLSIQVYAQNTSAVRLYHKLGFKTASRAPVRLHPCQPYYTGDVLLLLKPLGVSPSI